MVPSYQIVVEIVWEVHYVVVMGLASDDATLLTWWGQVFEGSQDSFGIWCELICGMLRSWLSWE